VVRGERSARRPRVARGGDRTGWWRSARPTVTGSRRPAAGCSPGVPAAGSGRAWVNRWGCRTGPDGRTALGCRARGPRAPMGRRAPCPARNWETTDGAGSQHGIGAPRGGLAWPLRTRAARPWSAGARPTPARRPDPGPARPAGARRWCCAPAAGPGRADHRRKRPPAARPSGRPRWPRPPPTWSRAARPPGPGCGGGPGTRAARRPPGPGTPRAPGPPRPVRCSPVRTSARPAPGRPAPSGPGHHPAAGAPREAGPAAGQNSGPVQDGPAGSPAQVQAHVWAC
jgi:hypothetical protein